MGGMGGGGGGGGGGMGGMGGGGGGAIGSLYNDVQGMVTNAFAIAKSQKDQGDIYAAYETLRKYAEFDPEKAKIMAQQMGLQPDVLAGDSRTAQLDALRKMQNIGDKGGMDNQAISANQQSGALAARQFQANQSSIDGRMQRQGVSAGSGAELAAKSSAAQSGYNTVAMAGAQNASNSQMRALQAINASGRLAGDIAGAEQGRAMYNTDAKNARDRYNTGIRDSANRFNANAQVDVWQRNFDKHKAVANAANAKAGVGHDLRDEEDKYWKDSGNRAQNIMGTVGGMGGG